MPGAEVRITTNLKVAALVAEVVGSIAVVVGLLFVGLELRQNTVAQRLTATQTLVVDCENALDIMSYEQEAACIYVRGISVLDNLTGIERYRFFVIWFHIFRAAEQLYQYSLSVFAGRPARPENLARLSTAARRGGAPAQGAGTVGGTRRLVQRRIPGLRQRSGAVLVTEATPAVFGRRLTGTVSAAWASLWRRDHGTRLCGCHDSSTLVSSASESAAPGSTV